MFVDDGERAADTLGGEVDRAVAVEGAVAVKKMCCSSMKVLSRPSMRSYVFPIAAIIAALRSVRNVISAVLPACAPFIDGFDKTYGPLHSYA